MKFETNDTIVALATAHGSSAIAVIRLSGPEAFTIIETYFYSKSLQKKKLKNSLTHTLHFGLIINKEIIIDEVLVSIFKNPNSFTGQDCAEVSCHGSPYIIQQLLQLFLNSGARLAEPGEFTLRAFLNGKFDLSQAEAVADLIASNSALSHEIAMKQMRGGFSNKIKLLREKLINFASLIELELDFSEEDVEFANRNELKNLVHSINTIVLNLLSSFELGNVIKNGIPVAIIGKPNAGKSTLLNTLLNDERAIVSEIAGTTRDTIEDEITIDGVLFRFIDTAGIRTTNDVIEQIGVNKAFEAIKKSAVIIYLFDVNELSSGDLKNEIELLKEHIGTSQLLLVGNKIDSKNSSELTTEFSDFKDILFISAKTHLQISELKQKLLGLYDSTSITATDTIVTNARHANSLKNVNAALNKVLEGLNQNIVTDILALDIRYALEEIGLITGEVTTDDLLSNIFSKFCIGK
jgi:tRNA modification GTPase